MRYFESYFSTNKSVAVCQCVLYSGSTIRLKLEELKLLTHLLE